MKKIYFLLMLIFTVNGAWAQLYEGFNYSSPGNVGGTCNPSPCSNNNWTTHSATTVGTIDILPGNLNYPGLQASLGNRVKIPGNNTTTTRDINIPTSIGGTPTTAYYSFLLKVIDNTQLAAGYNSANQFLSFGNTAGNTVGIFFGKVIMKSVNAGANFRIGTNNGPGSGTPTITEVAADLDFGSTYLVVIKYQITGVGHDMSTLWINPVSLGGTEPSGGVTNSSSSGNTATTFASICISNGAATPNAEIDEIRSGTSWASVTPVPQPPTVGSFTPASGYSGNSVIITGTNFNGTTAVTFGGTNAASFTIDNATQITATVGLGTSGAVNITTGAGNSSSAASFTYNGYITSAPGNWSSGTTWIGGTVPPANANVTLAHAIAFDVNTTLNDLILSGGQLSLGNNDLTVAGIVSGVSSSTYVVTNGTGRLIRNNITAAPVLFPIGTAASYTPVTISNGNGHNFSCNVQPDFTNPFPGNEEVLRQWNITDVNGGPVSATISFQWNMSDEHPSFNRNLCYVAHYGADWEPLFGTKGAASGSDPYTKTANNVTTFSPFTISSNAVILPLSLLQFLATKDGNATKISWITAAEFNLSHFEVERSADGMNYSSILNMNAASTPGSHNYSAWDPSPLAGLNYYRLKMVDKDGKFTNSIILKVDFGRKYHITILPNPVHDIATIICPDLFKQIQLTDITGKLVMQVTKKADNHYDLSGLKKGMYLLRLTGPGETITEKLIVQ